MRVGAVIAALKSSDQGVKRTLANQVGKRYQCTKCGTEMIVTKAGDGEIACCGQPMQQKQ